LLILATVIVVAFQARWTSRFKRYTAVEVALIAVAATASDKASRQRSLRFSAMFFASGFAALVYQVLFAKELALVFGSTATATLTVLATFLGGMAIGSLIGGVLAQRVRRPLLVYAAIEFGIAMYCILTPQLFGAIQSAYVAMASGMPPDAAALTVMRVVLGAAVLLVPTVLMGTTLPLLARAIASADGASLGVRVAKLYFANTGGAALGALLTAYFVIPALGAHRTTLIAAVVNLMVALAAIELFKTEPAAAVQSGAERDPGLHAEPTRFLPDRIRHAALLALGAGGLLSLGLEVVYIHMLAIVAGNSVYAFGLMVATFLVGLSIGGGLARPLLAGHRAEPVAALAISLFGLCISAALGSLLWNGVPDYFASFALHPAATSFASREAIRAVVCALLMIPPTLFIGAAYVLAIDLFTTTALQQRNLALGIGAAVNTLGNIVGVLLFGFVVLPGLGGLGAAKLIAAAALALATAVALIAKRPGRPVLAMGAVALLAVAISQGVQLNYDQISTGANVYFLPQLRGKVIAHAESIDGGLTTVNRQDTPIGPVLTLLTNGKFQGNDAIKGEMQAQVGFAFAPLLHQDHRDRALVIGYGTGVTSRAFHEAGFKKVDIAELSRDIVAMADGHFESVNRHASTAPGVSLHLTDGRNFLLLSSAQYDVISLEISSIWFAGAASLYNQEFYQLAKSKMKADGVLQQWVQLHHLSQLDVLAIVATIRSEFRYVSLYLLGDQGILVATDDPLRASPRAEAIAALQARPQLADLRGVLGRPAASLVDSRLLDADGVDRFIKEVGIDAQLWLSTDDNLRLEYDTPKGNVNDGKKSFQINKDLLTRFH
jgi:predicted membrane-bound spermidine synthase